MDRTDAPDAYLRVLSLSCLVRAQIGKALNAEPAVVEGLQEALRHRLWDEAILLKPCQARIKTKDGQYEEARRLLDEAVVMAEDHDKSSLQIRTLVLLSHLHLSNNEMEKALILLKKAESVLAKDRVISQLEQERLKVEVAMGLEAAGSHNVGVEIYEYALNYFTQNRLRSYQVVMHYNLSETYLSRGTAVDRQKSRLHYQSAADIALSLRDELTYVYALNGGF